MRRDEVETRVRREMQLGQGLGPTMRHPVPLAPRFSRFRHFPGQRSFWQRWFARRTAKNRHNTESTGYRSILVVSRVRFSNEDDLTPAVKAAFVQSLQGVQSPIAVEVIFDRAILIQFVGAPKDIALVRAQLAAHFPHAEIVPTPDALPDLAVIRAVTVQVVDRAMPRDASAAGSQRELGVRTVRVCHRVLPHTRPLDSRG